MMRSSDTIFALATPMAKSGIAIIRISGSKTSFILNRLTGKSSWEPGRVVYTAFQGQNKTILDKGLVIFFRAPASFTGEDVAELHLHGSLGVIREALDILSKIDGLRQAEPGEFTRRAFLNGKMDLLEAEGLADLIAAETPAQKTQALQQLGGKTSQHYEAMRGQVVRALALLESYIDFPDEDIPESTLLSVKQMVDTLQATLRDTLDDNHRGERLREGFRIVIVGAPNVGKSSLLNLLARREAAIVSPQPGTTRDAIDVHLTLAGFPVILTDTAGLRVTDDAIEKEGVLRAERRAGAADMTLVVLDAENTTNPQTAVEKQLTDKSLVIINKCDLLPDTASRHEPGKLYMSAKTGQGVDALLARIEERISQLFSTGSNSLITRARHRALLEEAQVALADFAGEKPLELTCESLRRAATAIGRITGKITVDDVLDVVFKEFCIGK